MNRREYDQNCAAARALDRVGERWTLLIVRELIRGPQRYTDLRKGLPGMASNLLAMRLKVMAEADLIEQATISYPSPRDVYRLTERGRELEDVLLALSRFGLSYIEAPSEAGDTALAAVPGVLTSLVLVEELTNDGFRVCFALDCGEFTMTVAPAGAPGQRLRLSERISVAITDSADKPKVTVTASLADLVAVRRGDTDAREALNEGRVVLGGGDPALLTVGRMLGFDRHAPKGAPAGVS